ncbi:MAG: serine/threonine protein kinase [Planctomycetes bacterium]|nr:serine/threonine protein kinase [Planctomycetota bacterium]
MPHQLPSPTARVVRTGGVASAAEGAAPRVDCWELMRRAATGALTDVYRARARGQAAVYATYAVKILSPRAENGALARALLRREAIVASQVTHAHLLPLLAQGYDHPTPFLVFPWLAGESLAQRIARVSEPLPLAHALWYARQMAEGLAALHAAGWLHGDVAPANVMIGPHGHVTLVDLGFAEPLGQHASTNKTTPRGTPAYIAPEQLTAGRVDARSDLYSLGVVLYQMLTGRLPLAITDRASLVAAHRQGRAADVREHCPNIPREVAKLVNELLSKQPLRRPDSAMEVVARLAALEVAAFTERGTIALADARKLRIDG